MEETNIMPISVVVIVVVIVVVVVVVVVVADDDNVVVVVVVITLPKNQALRCLLVYGFPSPNESAPVMETFQTLLQMLQALLAERTRLGTQAVQTGYQGCVSHWAPALRLVDSILLQAAGIIGDMQHKHPLGVRSILPPFFNSLQSWAVQHASTVSQYLLSDADVDEEAPHSLFPAYFEALMVVVLNLVSSTVSCKVYVDCFPAF
jgi:hypothetical protein